MTPHRSTRSRRVRSLRNVVATLSLALLLRGLCFAGGRPAQFRAWRKLRATEDAEAGLRPVLQTLSLEMKQLISELRDLREGLGIEASEAAPAQAAAPLQEASPQLPAEPQGLPNAVVEAVPISPPMQREVPSAPASPDTTALRVRSSGFASGNVAEFFLDGRKVIINGPADNRGPNVVVIDPASRRVVQGNCYDTWANPKDGNNLLASDISAVPQGHVVLVALKDSGMENLDEAALAALRSIGSTLTGPLKEREAYALVGVKGGQAMAEKWGAAAELEGLDLPFAVAAPTAPFFVKQLPGGHEPGQLPGGYAVSDVLKQADKMGLDQQQLANQMGLNQQMGFNQQMPTAEVVG